MRDSGVCDIIADVWDFLFVKGEDRLFQVYVTLVRERERGNSAERETVVVCMS